MPSLGSHAAWLDSQTPWPKKFGLGRIRTLLAALGDPQLAYPAIHVVGTIVSVAVDLPFVPTTWMAG